MMGPMPPGQAPAGEEQQAPGGASKLVADTHSNLMKIQELVATKFPEEAQALAQVIQAYQSVVDSLGSPANAEKPQEKSAPGMVPPEAGAANVKPAL